MSGSLRVGAVAGRGCARRFDFAGYVVFVSTFFPRASRFHHGHDDLLSYVVYHEGAEILCDPGRPSYQPDGAAFTRADRHNGLRSALPLRMSATPFVPTSFALPELGVRHAGSVVEIEALNPAFGGRKTMSFALEGDSLVIRENVACREGDFAGFTQCLTDTTSRLVGETTLVAGDYELAYESLSSLSLEGAERSVEYGETLPCSRLTGRSSTGTAVTRIRHV